MPELDLVLEAHSPGCYFEPVNAEDNSVNSYQGLWFVNYAPGPDGKPEPDIQIVNVISEALQASGAGITSDEAVAGLLGLLSTTAFTKVMDAADRRAAILLYGVVSMFGLGLYMYAPGAATAVLARAGWLRFMLYAKRYNNLIEMTPEDVVEFNTRVTEAGLPTWLRIPS